MFADRQGETSSTVGDRLVGQLLVEMAGLESRGDIAVIAATNRPDMIDQVGMVIAEDRALFV